MSPKRMEEVKLEMENLTSEREMEVLQNNSKFQGREGEPSTLSLENPQRPKSSFSLTSLGEKQENSNIIPRSTLGEESYNLLLEILKENVKRDEKELEEELVCKVISQLDDYKVPTPFLEALYSKTMLNSMNLDREDKIYFREMDEIISDIHMLCVDVENIVLDEKIEVYKGRQYEGKKEFLKMINFLMYLMRI